MILVVEGQVVPVQRLLNIVFVLSTIMVILVFFSPMYKDNK